MNRIFFNEVRRTPVRRYAAIICFTLLLLAGMLHAQDNPFESAGQANYAGRFVGQDAALRLKLDAGKWVGALTFKGEFYDLQSDNKDGKLVGTFGKDASGFIATCDGDELTFTAGTLVIKFQRQKLPKFSGVWGSPKVEMEFENTGEKLTGKIRFNGKEFSFAAAENGGDLEGFFKNGEKSVPFTVANEPRGLIFQSGTFAERIQRTVKAQVNSLGMKFVPVPGTEVLFCIWDVRVQDYRAYAEANSGVGTNWINLCFNDGDTYPVVNINWNDAKAFCEWLSKKEGKTYRLPTDAEWSVAVGLPSETGSTPKEKDMQIKDVYPWGTQWPPPSGAGNYADAAYKIKAPTATIIDGYDDGYAYTSPVESFAANKYGLYDMGGNVWQWCEDWYDGDQKDRVLRGASCFSGLPNNLLSSCRNRIAPDFRYSDIGFRCVLVGGVAP